MNNHVLIITADSTATKTLMDALAEAGQDRFDIEWITCLSDALLRLRSSFFDVVLVELSLPDSVGIDTFNQLFAVAAHTPIMVLSPIGDEMLALEAVHRGAQGYLMQDHFGSYLIAQSLNNIIQRQVVEESFFIEKSRAEITLNSISDAVIGTDMLGQVDYLNFAAESMTGWTRQDALGHHVSEVMQIINGKTRRVVRNPIELVLQQNAPMRLTAGTILIRRDGLEAPIEDSAAPIHDLLGQISGAVIVFHDITAIKAMAVKMTHLAQHDFLTKLPNCLLLRDRIEQAISLAKRQGNTLAILFLDLDNFKHINDSLGHATGDKLLQCIAERLTTCVRNSDTVSRQGGDEFVVLLSEDNYAENATLTADKILMALAKPCLIGEHELHVTTSIGISIYPTDGDDAATLLKNADTAMYQAKEKGRNNYQFFKSEMNIRAVERQMIEANLRIALERQQFVLYYQPKVDLKTGKITGAEVLLRWAHPVWGLTLPNRFIPIAEESGLIVPIGRWVLQQACKQFKSWEKAGLTPGSIAVNISALEFRHKDFVKGLSSILRETGLVPHHLQLEITESVLMRDVESSTAILRKLKSMGVQLAVDDFGTGYSSLSYLNHFPIDVLKIDRSFIRDIGPIHSNNVIISAIIGIGIGLNQQVVAEGIEKQAQLSFLKAEYCEQGQGNYFSPPIGAEAFAKLLAAENSVQVSYQDNSFLKINCV